MVLYTRVNNISYHSHSILKHLQGRVGTHEKLSSIKKQSETIQISVQ